nr:DUF2920 family protein [Campylobacter jejuni]
MYKRFQFQFTKNLWGGSYGGYLSLLIAKIALGMWMV